MQPQNTKKKQSIAVKATDSNAVTKVHNTSSIAKSNHLMLSRVSLVVKYEKSNSGHRKSDDDGIESPDSGHLKMDGYHIGRISLYQGNFLLNAKASLNPYPSCQKKSIPNPSSSILPLLSILPSTPPHKQISEC